MTFMLRGGTALAATALSAAALAAPAGAATHHSLRSLESHVKAADVALHRLDHARRNAGQAKRAVATVRKQASAARADAHYLSSHASAQTAATGAGLVALQYDWDLRTFTKLVSSSSPAVQSTIAGSLAPVLSGRTDALGLLSTITKALSGASATQAGAFLTGLIGSLPSEIGSLSGVAGGGQLSTTIESLLAQALAQASSALNAGIAQLQGVISMLPAPAQTAVKDLLTQLTGFISQLQSVLAAAGSAGSSGTGSGTVSGTGTGTGTGTGSGTGSGTAGALSPFGWLSKLPGLNMLSGLLGAFTGAGGAGGTATTGPAGLLSGLFGGFGGFGKLGMGLFGGLL